MKKLTQTGDTIVEVLISLTVLASVMGGAYAISNRALMQSQKAQERVQAIKLAEGQIERLKYLSGVTSHAQFDVLVANLGSAGPQCIDSGSVVRANPTPPDKTYCWDTALFNYRFTAYDPALHQFTLRVDWDALGGGTDNITMYYRVQP